jgi:hypothetical protein
MTMAQTSMPENLPHSIDQLIEELDLLNPAATIEGPPIDSETTQQLIFQAGRRSLVDELVRLLQRTRET